MIIAARFRSIHGVRTHVVKRLCRVWLAALLSFSVLALGGCSALRIGYSQAPDLMYWYLDGYLDFNASQTPKVREALTQWFAWHRRTQLPDYAAALVRAQADVRGDVTPARVCEWQGELLTRGRTAFDRFAPAAAEFIATETPQQVEYLERRYAKANLKFADDYLHHNPRKRAEAALRRTIDRLETLYGPLPSAQRAQLAEALARSPFDADAWFAERREQQQEALNLLRRFGTGATAAVAASATNVPPATGSSGADSAAAADRTAATTQAALRTYFAHMERSPREPYRRYAARLREFNCEVAAQFHNATSAAQRQVAARKLAGWEADARELARAAPPGNGAPDAGR